jgi:dUTP pyrophosphatase
MEQVGKFYKVSYNQFKKDWNDTFSSSVFSEKEIEDIYNCIQLPTRATDGSAGYDFKTPYSIYLESHKTMKIPTGIRVEIKPGWVLMCFPRSGLGFKYKMQLNNTVGIIDSDYFNSSNEGHIFAKITNDNDENKTINLIPGEGFIQGIFLPFGITTDDEENEKQIRNGGFGSTGK